MVPLGPHRRFAYRLLAAAFAVALAAAGCGKSNEPATSSAEPGASQAPAASAANGSAPPASGRPSASGAGGKPAPSAGGSHVPSASASGAGSAPCTRKHVTGTGITDKDVTIGQIVTDVNILPQQLGPARDGLQAFVKQQNAAGGVCGRKIKLEVTNDNANPATHSSDFRSLATRAFAFVANESLFDSSDYATDPPFAPTVTDNGQPVPDVGGLAFAYNRAQSAWHAGVVGSLSPTLVGGDMFRFYTGEVRKAGHPCTGGAIVYLREPTGASEDQARTNEPAVRLKWGGGIAKTKYYAANLLDPVPSYEVMADQMTADGMNCIFSFLDRGSSVNLVQALYNRGVWPPKNCSRGNACVRVVWISLSAFDPKFIGDGGPGALSVSTFVPHVPFNEASTSAALRSYLSALKKVPGATPSTFSVLAYASGRMFVDAMEACGGAPTRACVMNYLRALKNFDAGGLTGPTTPFRKTRVRYGSYGTFDWKWIFRCSTSVRVLDRGGKRDFYRVFPARGYNCEDLMITRGVAK